MVMATTFVGAAAAAVALPCAPPRLPAAPAEGVPLGVALPLGDALAPAPVPAAALAIAGGLVVGVGDEVGE